MTESEKEITKRIKELKIPTGDKLLEKYMTTKDYYDYKMRKKYKEYKIGKL